MRARSTLAVEATRRGRRQRATRLFDATRIHTQSDRTGAFASTLFAEFDQTIAIEFLEMQMANSLLKRSKICAIRLAFGAAPALFSCR
jgi:hypothetical protein